MSIEEIAALATGIVSAITLINLATRHYSEVKGGTWIGKIVKSILWAFERLSIVGTDGRAKVPLTERRPEVDDAGYIEHILVATIMLTLTALMILAISGLAGCGSALATISTSQAAVEVATPIVDHLCEPVRVACEARDEDPCAALGKCLEARVAAARALKSTNTALGLAAAAEAAGKSGDTSSWIELARRAIADVYQQISLWSRSDG